MDTRGSGVGQVSGSPDRCRLSATVGAANACYGALPWGSEGLVLLLLLGLQWRRGCGAELWSLERTTSYQNNEL